jgi:hypothetical protein
MRKLKLVEKESRRKKVPWSRHRSIAMPGCNSVVFHNNNDIISAPSMVVNQ